MTLPTSLRRVAQTILLFWLTACVAGQAAPAAGQSAPAGQAAATTKPAEGAEKTAGEQFKNIQVLKEIKATELIPAMRFMAGSLGVNCDFCHVNPWDKDEKKEKTTARKMIQMVKAINDANFDGKLQVTCATCHHGSNDPVSVPQMDQLVYNKPPQPPRPAPGSMPSADDVIAKYIAAVGGQAAADAVKTRVVKAGVTVKNAGPGLNYQAEFVQDGPDKFLSVEQRQQGALTRAMDGNNGWMQGPRGVRDLETVQLSELADDAAAFRTIQLGVYTAKQVFNKDTLNGHEVYVMMARTKGGRERLFFDTQSGLLLRRIIYTPTVLGMSPFQTDYNDYRDVGAVKVPFDVTYWYLLESQQLKYTSVQDNVTVDPARFTKPAAAAAPGQ